ncbi:hypothetical protein [Acidisarcina polymorpha]|uniref:hypothetical protein n=1 Tax=Acidisarcina polymorpha TaxID=2211140 RepID=UPI000DEF096E|nr:hypothetical protein [Acidisarcina polymorpha]
MKINRYYPTVRRLTRWAAAVQFRYRGDHERKAQTGPGVLADSVAALGRGDWREVWRHIE